MPPLPDALRARSLPATFGRRSVAWAGALLVAAVTALAAFDIVRSYRATLADAALELDGKARILAEHTARGVQAVDIALRHIAEAHRQGRLQAMTPEALQAYLREQSVGLVQIKGLGLYDRHGDSLATSWLAPRTPGNIAGFEVFRAAREGRSSGLAVGAATRSPSDGEWMIPIGRGLQTPRGEFAGAVGARLRIEYFEEFYRDIRLEPGTRVTLMHHDGTLLARYPPLPEALGQRYERSSRELLAAPREAGQPPVRLPSPVDGADRFVALQPVANVPIDVIVSHDAGLTLAAWRAHAAGTALRTLALAALAAVLLAIVARQFRRLDTARDKLEAARDKLAATSERFALAVAGSDDGIWDWDHVKRTVFASARARELLGLGPGPEVQPMDEWFASLRIHSEDRARRQAALDAHLEGRAPAYEGDYRVLHGEGAAARYRWVRVRGLCVRDEHGQPLRLAGSVADIDALKRAEASLRESESRYALAMTGSNEGHWVWDIDSDEMYASPTLRELLCIDPALELPTRTAFIAHLPLHPDDRERLRRVMADHLDGRTERIDNEYRIVEPATGEVRWLHTRAQCVRDASGRPTRMAGATVDVTQRKRAEEALRRSEERYELAVLGSTEGLWDWDMVEDMLFLSARCQELLWHLVGEPTRPRREWIDRTEYHPEDVAHVRAAISAHLHGHTQHMKVEYRLRHHGGEWHWYRQRGVAVRDAHGKPYRMAGSMEDITERKQAEAERERLEQQLRQSQRLEAMGTLAGGIAHDFNNILAAIVGYGEMVQKEAPEGTRMKRHIDATMRAAMRAKSLVERILAFSRSGLGERVPVHVHSVVSEALELVRASLPPRVKLERQLDTGHAAVLGDATQIHQVVMNLAANAVHAMGPLVATGRTGTLAVRSSCLELTAPRRVTTSELAPGRYVALEVRDGGVGIAPRVLERIFDPFFTTKEVGVGTGLGLSLVHGIVADLGGGIDVESEQGVGSTMTVYLPCSGEVQPAALAEAPVTPGRGETVLLVDDEEPLVRLSEELMAELGYEPVGFTSSAAALASFRNTPARFDIVVTDEAMPELTGSELVREIRKIRPDVPVVMMTGHVTAALMARARHAGVAEVLGKPLVAGEIARSVAAALRP